MKHGFVNIKKIMNHSSQLKCPYFFSAQTWETHPVIEVTLFLLCEAKICFSYSMKAKLTSTLSPPQNAEIKNLSDCEPSF